MTYLILALFSVWIDSVVLQVIAGLVLGMCIVGAHNFFHKRDNFRMYYMDLSPLSSFEWRLSHALSHHMYPNTVLVMRNTMCTKKYESFIDMQLV